MIVKKSSIIGYCYGVSNTIKLAEECLKEAQKQHLPCYSLGKLIHNDDVVSYFENRGLKPIKTPTGNAPGVALIRAHGITDSAKRAFQAAGFQLIDSTCPTVLKGVKAIRTAAKEGKKIIILGFAGHAETVGLQGVEVQEGVLAKTFLLTSEEDAKALILSNKITEEEPVIVVTQTTFPQEDYRKICKILEGKFKNIGIKNCPCPLCEKREQAGYELSCQCDCAVVVGGRESANTKNLAKVAQKSERPVFLVENVAGLEKEIVQELRKYRTVALLSGSSTPMEEIEAVEQALKAI